MENAGMETLTELKPDGKMPQRVLFTYYQGDINAVVDEHFTRALKKVTVPTDLSTKTTTSSSNSSSNSSSSSSMQNTHISRGHQVISKPRGKNKTIKAEPPALASWGQTGPEWSKGSYPCGPVGALGSFPSAEGPAVASQGVIMGPGGLSSSVWGYHPRPGGGGGFDLAPMLYPPAGTAAADAAAASSSSFLSLLHMDRPAGGVVMAPKVEGAEWDSAAAFRDVVGGRIGLDSGDQTAEKGKNLYWY